MTTFVIIYAIHDFFVITSLYTPHIHDVTTTNYIPSANYKCTMKNYVRENFTTLQLKLCNN